MAGRAARKPRLRALVVVAEHRVDRREVKAPSRALADAAARAAIGRAAARLAGRGCRRGWYACSACAITNPGASSRARASARALSLRPAKRARALLCRRRGRWLDPETRSRASTAFTEMRAPVAAAASMLGFMRKRFSGSYAADGLQARVVRPVARGDALAFVLGQEVDVAAAGRVRSRLLEDTPRPRAHALVVAAVGPAAVHVHDVVRVAGDERGRVGLDARHRAAELGEEDLALRPGQGRRRRDRDVDRVIAQAAEVVRIPVVAPARGEERIERLLESGVWGRPDVDAERIAERSTGRRCAGLRDAPLWTSGKITTS